MPHTNPQTTGTLAYASAENAGEGTHATPLHNLLNAARFAARFCCLTIALPLGLTLVLRYSMGLTSTVAAHAIVHKTAYGYAALTVATFGYFYIPAETRRYWVDSLKVFGLILAITLGVLFVLAIPSLIIAWNSGE